MRALSGAQTGWLSTPAPAVTLIAERLSGAPRSLTQMLPASAPSICRSERNAIDLPSGDTAPCHSAESSGVSLAGSPEPSAFTANNCHTPFGGRCEKTIRPSRVHDGHRSSPAIDVIRFGAAPGTAGVIHRSNSPLESAAYTMDLPSGDHAASRSEIHPAGFAISRFVSRPSGVIVYSASYHVTTRRLLSGDHAASRTPDVDG